MSRRTYHPLAQTLHWATFALILVGLPIGLIMTELDAGPVTNTLYVAHWSIGLTVLALTAIRLATRLVIAPPPPAAILAPWERTLSRAVHAGLYVMLFTMPILGWLGKSAYGAGAEGISVYGLFHVPVLLSRNGDLAETLFWYHERAAWIFLALLALHVAGALRHALIARDGVAGRMGLGRHVAEPQA